MSFGSGGFGGFGQNNNNAQSGGFGGFGSNNNNAPSAFGQATSGGFAQNNTTGGSLFGGNSGNTGGGFGTSTGGFGSNTGGGFGSKPAFGTSTSGGLFGANNANNANTTSTFGGFGGGSNTAVNPTTSAFGSGGNTTGGIFGANKSGFGTSTNTGGSLFGGGNTTSGGFGTTSTGFAATGAVGDPPGTASTPFNAFTEKEPNTSVTNSFQNILFQEPYKKWSSEELRLADYVQGRRHGNATGGGAFGVSSGFGGFGSTNANQTANAFGQTNTNTTSGNLFGNTGNATATGTGFGSGGFGANANATNTTGGSLFGGGNKPAGGLFGNSNTQTQQSGGGGGGGMFGGGGTGAFGSSNTGAFGQANTANNAGGGLFGNTANKTTGSGFSFGNTNNTSTITGPAFGANATGNAFGSTPANTGGGVFGNNPSNTQTTGGGVFGAQNNQQQSTGTGFGGGFGQLNQNQQSGGLFGNQQKPATGGLFGNSTATGTTGGIFGGGNAQQQNTGGGIFGTSNNAMSGGGLFGGGNKSTTGGGLFGGGNNAQATTGGSSLFGGGNTQQQSTGGGLFGASTNQQKPGGLFGSSTQTGGLFGGQNNPAQGSSLFGGGTNQQQNQNTLGNSLLGSAQQNNNVPQGLTANLNDVSAYGNPSLFAGLGGNDVANPGPLATPLNGNSKPRKGSILPMYKLAPATAASRFATPQKRGFGFSYSSYGTPGGSPASSISSTPGAMGRSLLGTSSGGHLSKSISASNLRRSFNTEDSILAPGAFSSSSSARWYGSTGSKKLVINRDIRSDLFSTPQKDRIEANGDARKLSKRVSFDTSHVESEDGTPVRNALPAPEDTPKSQLDETTPRQSRTTNGTNGSLTPEMEEVKGNELAIVHEEDNSATPEARTALGFENAPGDYWMQPSREELQNMNRMQRQRVDNFTVGRDNVGSIRFKVPVDISNIELDDLCGGIIQLEPRSATVYPVQAKKPLVGKGLNVPAQISLEQSWPRGGRDKRITSDPKRFNKHIDRLKRIPDTTFKSYDKDTGVWTFDVKHFTTYGLDDSDDESDEDIAPPPGLATPPHRVPTGAAAMDAPTHGDSHMSFRQNAALPGAFDEQDSLYERDDLGKQTFLGISSADSAPNDVRLSLEEDYSSERGDEYDLSEEEDMTRSFVGQHLAAELDDTSLVNEQDAKGATPGGILRARMRAMKDQIGPVTLEVADGDDWMEMLRKTVSPVKRDRRLLKEMNDSPSKFALEPDVGDNLDPDLRKTSIWGKSMSKTERANGLASTQLVADKGRGFATSIDLMNSLFEKPQPARQNIRASAPAKGFPQWPYERQDKNLAVNSDEKAYHKASRPTWGPDETLVVTRPLDTAKSRRIFQDNDLLQFQRSGIQTERQDIRLAKFSVESSKKFLRAQDKVTEIRLDGDIPMATLRAGSLQDVFHQQEMNDPAHVNEKRVWELASILFDGVVYESEFNHMSRRLRLSQFWTELVEQASTTNIGLAGSSEEKAVASLAGHRVAEACKFLLDGKNFRLGTLVALIGSNDAAKKDVGEQLKAWHDSKMLSEFSEAIRAVYELLSGNVCVCEGVKNVPVEDRVESFVISKKFGLDWRQAFGLRLWYAISQQDSPAVAVLKFKEDINQDKEELPRPWYYEQGLKPMWNDAEEGHRQDLLWGLLQLYADRNVDLEAMLRPENSQLSPLNMRLSWQLGQALVSTGQVSFGKNGDEKADASTIAYASQLTAAGEWLEAVFVLLHLNNSSVRMRAIQEHLCRHAGMIGPDTGATFALLTEKFRIPASWLWEALALYMRSVKRDASAEVHCLLRAGEFVEAHRVLVHQVAPQAVIEQDYATLSSLLSQFQGREEGISQWGQGGEIYGYFLSLVQHRGKGEGPPLALLEKLMAGLNVMKEHVGETEVLRYAALSDMADDAAREISKLARNKQVCHTRIVWGVAPEGSHF
ncbi:nucleoporin SONB [Metarhizium album ARSEF 1941]|uniref:Nucleoporin SONB n=1 Tax=Metarhizium album (strain ARSEF 1941) TaxID=1081103 RepID=A0A0B2X7E7_METAS|nr:nucleoporin SONB [Metarhizium album ARSEF 1941]KHO01683.1 nucleoporin SONB [Metarhizium album ARSEF 1941]